MALTNTEFYPAQDYYIFPMKGLLEPMDDPTRIPDDENMMAIEDTDSLLALAKYLEDDDVVMLSGDNPDTCIIWLDLDKETCESLLKKALND